MLQVAGMYGKPQDGGAGMNPHPEPGPVSGYDAAPGTAATEDQGGGGDRTILLQKLNLAVEGVVVKPPALESIAGRRAQQPGGSGEPMHGQI